MISGLYWKKISRQKVISLWIPSFSKSCFFWCEMVFALRFLYCDISVTDIPASAAWVAVVLSRIRYQAMTNEPLYRTLAEKHENHMNSWTHLLSFIAVQYEWLPVDSWAHIRVTINISDAIRITSHITIKKIIFTSDARSKTVTLNTLKGNHKSNSGDNHARMQY